MVSTISMAPSSDGTLARTRFGWHTPGLHGFSTPAPQLTLGVQPLNVTPLATDQFVSSQKEALAVGTGKSAQTSLVEQAHQLAEKAKPLTPLRRLSMTQAVMQTFSPTNLKKFVHQKSSMDGAVRTAAEMNKSNGAVTSMMATTFLGGLASAVAVPAMVLNPQAVTQIAQLTSALLKP
ncbi:MAG: hypothetical protein KTR14_11620 [Vampirovibrio sp.]|nr:hypothetical protein [Vampirovibrio sp.]